MWSYGGGVQSVTIGVLIATGRLPVPERTFITDTGRENPRTWAYLRQHMAPLLARVGVTVEVIASAERPSIYDSSGRLMLPVFAASGGKLPPLCSDRWKRRRVRAALRAAGYGPSRPVQQWLGFSVDEVHRAKSSDALWIENHYPLLFDVPLRRDECISVVRAAGLPDPPKSACWLCPHMRDDQWRELRAEEPALFAEACRVDAEMTAEKTAVGSVFLHRSLRPLAEVEFGAPDDTEDLFELACAGEGCFT